MTCFLMWVVLYLGMINKELVKTISNKEIESKIDDYFSMYSARTIEAYKTDIRLFYNLMNINLKDITLEGVVSYINKLEELNYSNSTFNRKIYSISKVLDVYVSMDLIEYNPVKKLRGLKKLDKKIVRHQDINLTLEDVKKVIEVSYPRTALIISLLADTGLRISELLNIKQTDIESYNDEVSKIKIMGKGSKERRVYIKNELLEDIKNIYSADSDYLFHSKKGFQLSRQNVYVSIRKSFSKIGKSVSPHQLRHFFVDYKINKEGKEIKATSLYVGHSSVNITLDYYVNTELKAEDANIL